MEDASTIVPEILKRRAEKRSRQNHDLIINSFPRALLPWVDGLETTDETELVSTLTDMALERGFEIPISVSDVPPPREDPIDVIKKICLKYPEESSSREIMEYVTSIGL